jgi:hypothetical protein
MTPAVSGGLLARELVARELVARELVAFARGTHAG